MFVDVVEGSVEGDEGGDGSAVFDELDSYAFSDSGAGFSWFSAYFFEDDAGGLGCSFGWGHFSDSEHSVLVFSVAPSEVFALLDDFLGGVQSGW